MHGFHPWTGLEGVKVSEQSPGARNWKEQWENSRKAAILALEKAAESMKRFYHQKQAPSHDYKEGQMVWLDGWNIKTFWPSKKLDQKRLGLFKVLEMIGRRLYQLQLPRSWNWIHPVFNEVLLSPYYPPQFSTQQLPDPPELVNMEGYPEYEVEEILSARKWGRGIQYLVKWKDYWNEENTWEPCHHLDHASELIQEFYQRYPAAIRRIVYILGTTGKSLTVGMRELQGVIEMKTDLRKGYCQDPLPKESNLKQSGRSYNGRTQGCYWNNDMDTFIPSEREVKETHQNNGMDTFILSERKVQEIHQNNGMDTFIPLEGGT